MPLWACLLASALALTAPGGRVVAGSARHFDVGAWSLGRIAPLSPLDAAKTSLVAQDYS